MILGFLQVRGTVATIGADNGLGKYESKLLSLEYVSNLGGESFALEHLNVGAGVRQDMRRGFLGGDVTWTGLGAVESRRRRALSLLREAGEGAPDTCDHLGGRPHPV